MKNLLILLSATFFWDANVVADDPPDQYPTVRFPELALPEWQNYSPIEARLLQERIRAFQRQQSTPERQVLKGYYKATLADERLKNGQLKLLLSDKPTEDSERLLSFGRSNLEELQINDNSGSLGLANDADGRLLSIRTSVDSEINGTWTAKSRRRGRAIVFQLQLPEAAVSTVEIVADSRLQPTCPNGLVRQIATGKDLNTWQFLPADPRKLTMEFSSSGPSFNDRSRRTAVAADVLINEAETRLTWTVPLRSDPALFATFELSEFCKIQDVQCGDQSLTWSQKNTALSVDLAQRTSDRPIQIEANVPTSLRKPFSVPFLQPLQFVQAKQAEDLPLESSVVRIQVDPLLAVERPKLIDVLQESFTADGNRQVLELRQYGADPEVQLRLWRSLPLIEERMVVATGTTDSPTDTVVWVNIKAAAGVIDRLSWIVPDAWRITDVREQAEKSSPLLFRQEAVDRQSSFELQTVLRTPLSVGNDQTLRITMQAIDQSNATRTPASLHNDAYIRITDRVAMKNSDDPRLGQIWPETDNTNTEQDDLFWLKTTKLDGFTFVDRDQLRSSNSESSERDDTFASVYSTVEINKSEVVESVRIRLRNTTELPPRFTIAATSGLRPELTEAADGTDWFRSSSTADTDEWTLELPTDRRQNNNRTEFEFLLTNTRPLTDRMPGLVVNIRNATLQGGRLEQPSSESGLVLRIDKDDTAIDLQQTIEYPADTFRLEILNKDTNAKRIAVNGRSYLLLAEDGDMLRATEIHRCVLQTGGLNRFLTVRSLTRDIRFFINGAEISVEPEDGLYAVPIPPGSAQIRLDVVARSRLKNRFPSRLLTFSNADETNIVTAVQSGPGQTISGASKAGLSGSIAMADTIRDRGANDANLDQLISDFESLWRLSASLDADHVVMTGVTQNLQIVADESQLTWIVVIGVATFLVWPFIGRHPLPLAGATLIVIVFLKWLILKDWPFILLGLTTGTFCFGLQMIGQTLTVRRQVVSPTTSIQRSTVTLIILLSLATSVADDRPPVVQPLSEGSQLPLLFVDNDFLKSLNDVHNKTVGCVALSVDVELQWQQPGILKGTVSVVTGCRPDQSGQLNIPTEGLTLTSANCDGKVVFPRKHSDGRTFIEIPNTAELQASLTSGTKEIASDGPNRYANWDIRTVKYSFLQSASPGNGEYGCIISFPKSPVANLRLNDPERQIQAVYLDSTRLNRKGRTITFPAIYHADRLAVRIKPRQADSKSIRNRRATVDINAVVSPNRIELEAEYRIRPANLSTSTAIVGIIPNQSLAVETMEGDSLRWSLLGDEIAIAIAPDALGEQRFRLLQTVSSELNTAQTLPIGSLLQVNPQRIDTATLSARAVEPFLMQPLQADGRLLAPLPDSPQPNSANNQRRFQLPADTDDLSFQLMARTSSIEPVISQQVTVRDDTVDWSCRCELDVTGAPIFQQLIYVSPDVTINSVDARNSDTTRLQSWSRTQDAVLITLREATQGIVDIQLSGFTKRIAGQKTPLPVITFPEGIIPLASDLEIRSGSTSRCYLSNLGGAIADNQFDLNTPLSAEPLRLSVVNDQTPVVIRATQDQVIQGSLTSYVYSTSGQARIAHALSCQLTASQSPVRFRLRNPNSTATGISVFRNGKRIEVAIENGIVTVPPAADNSTKLRLILAEQIPGIRNNSLSATLPEFEDKFTLTASRCFDVRDNLNGPQSRIPAIDRSNFATIDLSLPEQGTLQPMTANLNGRQLLIRAITPAQGSDVAEAAGGVAYVDEEHVVQVGDNFVSGTTSLLSFSTSSRAQLQLNIPPRTVVTRILIDGQSVFIGTPESTIELPLQSSVCLVTVDWVRQSDSALLENDFTLPLVSTSAAQNDRRIGIVDQTSSTRLSLKSLPLNPSELQDFRAQSLSSGMQFAELQDSELDESTTQPSAVPLLMALQQQISRLSPDAATAYDRNLKKRAATTSWIGIDAPKFEFQRRRRWSTLHFGLLLAGTVMLTIPMVQNRRQPTMPNRSEASTIVNEPKNRAASEKPTQLVLPEAESEAKNSSTAM